MNLSESVLSPSVLPSPLSGQSSSPEKPKSWSAKSRQSTLSLSRPRKEANGTPERKSVQVKIDKVDKAPPQDLASLEARLREKEIQLAAREAVMNRQIEESKQLEKQFADYRTKAQKVGNKADIFDFFPLGPR